MSDSKYKDFRNYMTNELGITRHDIEAWTKEAVATEVHKLVTGRPLQELAEDAVKAQVRSVVQGNSYSGPSSEMKRVMEKALMEQLVGKISITVKDISSDDLGAASHAKAGEA